MEDNLIYEFTWTDKTGKQRTITTVGNWEFNDQVMYLNQLETTNLIKNPSYKCLGRDT